jgi:vitamin K-dependent gamma-carboxylase
MMLVYKQGAVRFEAVDPHSGERWPLEVAPLLTQWQRRRAALDPDTILQLAHHLARELRSVEGRDFEIRARALVSLNGRRPQLLIDPEIDLSSQPRSLWPKPWILPLAEPLRDPPWDRPVGEWFESSDVTGEQTQVSP